MALSQNVHMETAEEVQKKCKRPEMQMGIMDDKNVLADGLSLVQMDLSAERL